MKRISKKQKLKIECVKLATEKKLLEHPRCMFCNDKSTTAHHFIRQSRSNYLKCDKRNLIPVCAKCHFRLHNGYEQIMSLQLRKLLGDEWAEGIIKDSRITIKDNLGYWKKIKELLTE